MAWSPVENVPGVEDLIEEIKSQDGPNKKAKVKKIVSTEEPMEVDDAPDPEKIEGTPVFNKPFTDAPGTKKVRGLNKLAFMQLSDLLGNEAVHALEDYISENNLDNWDIAAGDEDLD